MNDRHLLKETLEQLTPIFINDIMTYPLFTAEQSRTIDHRVSSTSSVSSYGLMKRAGQGLFQCIQSMPLHVEQVHVFCGAGNNAGDGYVLAKLLIEANVRTQIYAVADTEYLTGDALKAFNELNQITSVITTLPDKLDAGVVVDALLGTGLTKPISGQFLAAVTLINAATGPVLAVDIPSGLCADTGSAQGVAVCADITLSFIVLKNGLYTGDGPHYCGEVRLDDLLVGQDMIAPEKPTAKLIAFNDVKRNLKRRARNTHKGHYGHVLLVGGNTGYSGSIRLAGEAALRVGSGLVSIVTKNEHAALITMARPELMCHGIDDKQGLNALSNQCTVLGIGPGLGQTAWSKMLFDTALEQNLPLVVDADGLNLLAKEPRENNQWVLTPHPAEAARLLSCTTAKIQADRFFAVKALQKKYGGVVVLKGSGSLICGGEDVLVCEAGNPGMASGGMGDVLTGVISGLIAQGHGLLDAAALGVVLHAMAGDDAARDGESGLLASDLFQPLRELVNAY